MLDFRNLTFSSPNLCMLCMHLYKLPNSKFRLNRTIWSRSQKMINFFNMVSVRHLEFWNFWNFLTFLSPRSKFASAYQIVKFGQFASEIWRYNNFQNDGRPPCWIYCDVIILYRKTEFDALDIVLNFDVHRFHTFWYTHMCRHFSLKLPILTLISGGFFGGGNMGKY